MTLTNDNKLRDEIRAFVYLLGTFRDEDLDIYNALAPGYDIFARSWDEVFAEPALRRMFEILKERVVPGGVVLDAGCGTGRRIPRILETAEPSRLVALDISDRMLEMAERKKGDKRVEYRRGDIRHLPFPDGTFDAVVSTWTVELTDDPHQVVTEYLRVIKPGGIVLYTFVTLPTGGSKEIADRLAGCLLDETTVNPEPFAKERRPFHSCDFSVLENFREGILSVVCLGKCCSVEPEHLPAREAAGS